MADIVNVFKSNRSIIIPKKLLKALYPYVLANARLLLEENLNTYVINHQVKLFLITYFEPLHLLANSSKVRKRTLDSAKNKK